ncbi:nucleotide pyrophosphohydrolase [Motiliproteus sp. SC1-56]|uniref:nucleotide pyrophosphohydrolase n=1 Tax=Motiliproteus sp. SC1-56 TaxID=2799565 RepID=UPI001A8D0362|nr:nucleotide pyrophosphohydrolase [Motiliproteus sp. SC1-56]
MMDLEEIYGAIQAFATERDWDQYHNPKNLVMALSVEAAELVEEFQWLTPEQAENLDEDPERLARVRDEIADVAVYLIRLSGKLGIDMEGAIEQKMRKNAEKYPAEKVRGSAKKYTEY